MAINKVVYNNNTLLDLTDTTATASDVAQGKYFYNNAGVKTLGTNQGGSGDGYVWQDAQGYVHLSDEQGTQPIYDTLTVSSSGTFTPSQGHAYNSVIVPSGTAGTPSATKSAVSNHSVNVTPSVTNTAGYISGGTKTGTAVSVSASELVSGNLPITANADNIDIANYSTVSVNVGGGVSNWSLITSRDLTYSTTSTSSTTIEWWDTSETSIWNYDVIYVRVRDKAGKRSGYFYGSDNYFINPFIHNIPQSAASNTYSVRFTIYVNTSGYGAANHSGSTGYGVYASAYEDTGSIRLMSRYNSAYGTVDGTYSIEVYSLSPPTGKPFFE